MARQVLTVAGFAAGFFLPGGPAVWGAIGSALGNAVDPQVIKGPKLGEAGLQTSAEGGFRAIVRGKGAIKGNVGARGNRQVKTRRTQQGKGGGPVTEEQRVYWTFKIDLGEPVAAYLRIWQDEKLVYDVTPGSTIVAESADFASRCRFYYGDEDQLPDPDFEAFMGVGNVSAYRGTSYVVFPNYDLTDYREMIPQFRFEVASAAAQQEPTAALALYSPGGISFSAVYPSADGDDWTDPAIGTGIVGIGVAAGPDGFIVWSSAMVRYTLDDGSTWQTASNTDMSQAIGDGCYGNGRYFIAAGTQGVASSAAISGPYAVDSIPGMGAAVTAVAADDMLFYALIDFQRRVASSSSVSGPWTVTDLTDIANGTFSPIHANAGEVRIGGGGGSPSPRIERCIDRVTWVAMTLPVISGATKITRLHHDATLDMWFAGTDNGRILVDDGSGWQLTAINMGGLVNGFASNGAFVIAAALNTGTNDSLIANTTDGFTWSSASSGLVLIQGLAARVPGTGTVAGAPIPLSTIVAERHERAGHTASQYDVSELTDLVEGVVFADDYTAADAIRTLMPIYRFDASEYDGGTGYKVHYPKRGKPVVGVVTEADLIEAPEKTVREDSYELPKKFHLLYQNPTVGYVPAKATASRDSPDVKVVGERSIQIPVSFSDVDEPAKIANRLMKLLYVERGGLEEFTVHDGLLEWVPSDCIGLTLRGQTRRMRITQEQIGPGELKWKLIPDRQSVNNSSVTGIPLPAPTPPLPSIVGQTVYNFMDLPALNDNNDILGWYEAASGQTEAWHGAQTQRKAGAAVEFEDSVRFTQNTIMGVLVDPIASASEHFTDTTNVVRVQLFTDDMIESQTYAQFLSEGGSMALEKADGSWEVMQHMDSDDEGDRVFALTTLLRGRLNTGSAAHLAGARVVMLDGVKMVPAVTAWLDTNIVTRAVSLDTSPDGAPQYTNAFTGKSQTEFPVGYLFLERDGDTIETRAVPRNRLGTVVNPIRSINWSGYRWTATDGSNTATADTLTDTHSFDVTGWASPITVTVAQLNRYTGAGPTVSEDIA